MRLLRKRGIGITQVKRILLDRDTGDPVHTGDPVQKRKVSLWLVVSALVVGVLRNQLLLRRLGLTIVGDREKTRVQGHVAQGIRVPDRVPISLASAIG